MIKAFPAHHAFPLGLIELHRSLSSIRLLSAALPTAAFSLKTFEFEIPTVIRAACSVLTHLNSACNYKSRARLSPPVVGGGSARSQRDRRWRVTFEWAVWWSNKCRGIQLAHHLYLFDRTMAVNLRSERERASLCVRVWDKRHIPTCAQIALVGKSHFVS